MSACQRLRADAAGLAALPPGDPELAAARAHAAGCPGCARALAEAGRLQELLGELEPLPVPGGALERASAAIAAELRREARRRALASAAAAAAVALLLAALGRHRSHAAGDWAQAGILGALALCLAALAGRRARAVVAAAAASALGAAAVAGRGGLLDAALGLDCLAAEIVGAAAVVGAGWLALRAGSTTPARPSSAAAAAAGALAADAALQITCAGRDHLPHLLVFHLGGVLLAAALASLVRPRPGRAASRAA